MLVVQDINKQSSHTPCRFLHHELSWFEGSRTSCRCRSNSRPREAAQPAGRIGRWLGFKGQPTPSSPRCAATRSASCRCRLTTSTCSDRERACCKERGRRSVLAGARGEREADGGVQVPAVRPYIATSAGWPSSPPEGSLPQSGLKDGMCTVSRTCQYTLEISGVQVKGGI